MWFLFKKKLKPDYISVELFERIEKYLDEQYKFRCEDEYKGFWGRLYAWQDSAKAEEENKKRSRERYWTADNVIFNGSDPNALENCYEEYIAMHKIDNFSVNLTRLIAKKGLDHVDVYKKARMDRRLFSKIRNDPDYIPSKRTVFALAIGMRLELRETRDLLYDAGFSISKSILFDVIMEFFIKNHIYDMNQINEALVEYKLEPF